MGTKFIELARWLLHTVYTIAVLVECVADINELRAIIINYHTQNIEEYIREQTDKRGVDVILDMVAGEYIERDIRCLADDGRIVVIALLGGRYGKLDCAHLMTRRLTITGSTLRPRDNDFKAEVAQKLQAHHSCYLCIIRGRPSPHDDGCRRADR